MESRISIREAGQNFASVLDRVRELGEAFIVEQYGEAFCRIAPVGITKRL